MCTILARLVKYGITGILAALSQLKAMIALVEDLGLTTSLGLNLAYKLERFSN